MERIMISYPEFLGDLEKYRKDYDYTKGVLRRHTKTERMLIGNLIFRLADIHLYILGGMAVSGAGVSYVRLSIPSINRIIDELMKISLEKYGRWKHLEIFSKNDNAVLKEVTRFFIGKILTIKRTHEEISSNSVPRLLKDIRRTQDTIQKRNAFRTFSL